MRSGQEWNLILWIAIGAITTLLLLLILLRVL